jgi:hypothetical protein
MILDLTNYDLERFSLGKSGRNVKILYDKEPFQVCTTTLYTPFGVKNVSKEWSNFNEYWLDCSLNQSPNENSSNFRKFIDDLDKKIVELVNNNKDFFQNYSDNLQYNAFLRENKEYPKLAKLQLPRDKNGNFESFVFDENKKKIRVSESTIEELLTRGKTFKCIIECSKIWVYNGKIGSMWNIVQLKLAEQKNQQTQQNQQNLLDYSKLLISD